MTDTPAARRHIPSNETAMKYTTDTRDRRGVERAVEGILDKWATGDTAAQTSIYVTKLRLTAEDLRQETQAIEQLADQEAQ